MRRPHPPRRIRRAARQARLGRTVKVYDPRRQAYVWIGLVGVAGVALGVAGLDYRRSEQPVAGWATLGLSALYLTAVAWIAWRVVIRGRVVYLMEKGFVMGRPTETFAWDELVSVTMAGVRRVRRGRTEWRFTVVTSGGRETELSPGLPGVSELGELVIAEVTARVLPWYLRAVRTGGTVSFGPFLVDREGIAKDGDRIPWASVQDVVIENGVVQVLRSWDFTGGGGLAATVGAVPNAVAFTALCGKIRADSGVGRQ
jgi:hypothetical protein